MTTDRPTVHFFQLFAHHISTVGVSTMLSTPRCHHRCHRHRVECVNDSVCYY